MYIESAPNRSSPPAILLRDSYRDGARIKKRTIANLSDWPRKLVEGTAAIKFAARQFTTNMAGLARTTVSMSDARQFPVCAGCQKPVGLGVASSRSALQANPTQRVAC